MYIIARLIIIMNVKICRPRVNKTILLKFLICLILLKYMLIQCKIIQILINSNRILCAFFNSKLAKTGNFVEILLKSTIFMHSLD